MIATISRYAFRIAVALLTIGILVVGTFLVLIAVPDMAGDVAEAPTAAAHARPQPLAAVRHGACRPWASRCRPTPTAMAAT